MSEAFKKQLARCRRAHLWTGIFNGLSVMTVVLLIWFVWAMMRYMPEMINSEFYVDEQRQKWNEISGKLPWVLGVLVSFLVYMAVVTFLAFDVWWCLGKGRHRRYCHVASWVQGLNFPMGTGAAFMAVRLMWSNEGKAHFGEGVVATEVIATPQEKREGVGEAEIKRQAHESETQD